MRLNVSNCERTRWFFFVTNPLWFERLGGTCSCGEIRVTIGDNFPRINNKSFYENKTAYKIIKSETKQVKLFTRAQLQLVFERLATELAQFHKVLVDFVLHIKTSV
jgi:hypothetical protein